MKKQSPKIDLKRRPLSYSSLKQFAKSPQHYVHYLTQPREPSDAMLLGSLVDCLVFEKDKFKKRYAVLPNFKKTTKAGRESVEKFREVNKGKEVISRDLLAKALKIERALMANTDARYWLDQLTEVQHEIKFWDNPTKLQLRGFLDGLADDFILDLKTTTDASPETFTRQAYNMNYHLQAAIYQRGVAAETGKWLDYYFVVVETKEPFGVAVYRADEDFIELGKKELRLLLDEFRFCFNNDLWNQSYDFRTAATYTPLELPGYAKMKL